jgi:two-component system, sensor histidine kinase and response regulator
VRQRTEHRQRLIVVDDEESFLILVARALEDQDFDVTAVSNGEEAINLLRETTFDLALLDIRMFEINGIDLLKIFRKESPTTDCIMITGFHEVEIAVEAIKLGAKEFLTKPINMNDLISRVKSVARAHIAETHLREIQAEFSSRLLHDLLSPLHTLRSAVEFLSNEGARPGPQHSSVIQSMKTTIDSMDGMLNDMIDLSLFESGRIDIERIPSNLDELVPNICSRIKPQADAKGVTLAIEVSNSIPTLEIDPIRIDQIVSNLLQNSITHTPPGGKITVTVASETEEDPDNPAGREMVTVTVADTGAGIDPGLLPFLFDKYKKVIGEQPKQKSTSGLGLPICKSIIEAHHGSITAESDPGNGAIFRFTLPVTE